MAKIIDHHAEFTEESPRDDREAPFAEIDAREFDQARRDPSVRRFADAADRYFAALKRSGKHPAS